MLSKQLLFRLGFLALIVSTLSVAIFKVSEISFDITRTSIQSLMEPSFFIDGESKASRIKYEMVDPMVTISDAGDVVLKSNVTFSSGLDQEWGTMQFVAKPMFVKKKQSLFLTIPESVQFTVSGKSSSDAGFQLWGKDAAPLVAQATEQINDFLSTKVIHTLQGKHLRIQAERLSIRESIKTADGIHVIMDVEQSMSIFITYFIMFLSIMIIAFAYFFIGDVGFKDKKGLGFRDPRRKLK